MKNNPIPLTSVAESEYARESPSIPATTKTVTKVSTFISASIAALLFRESILVLQRESDADFGYLKEALIFASAVLPGLNSFAFKKLSGTSTVSK